MENEKRNRDDVLETFLLAKTPLIITQEEFNDVQKAIRELQIENDVVNSRVRDLGVRCIKAINILEGGSNEKR